MADRRQGGVALALYLHCSCGFPGAERWFRQTGGYVAAVPPKGFTTNSDLDGVLLHRFRGTTPPSCA